MGSHRALETLGQSLQGSLVPLVTEHMGCSSAEARAEPSCCQTFILETSFRLPSQLIQPHVCPSLGARALPSRAGAETSTQGLPGQTQALAPGDPSYTLSSSQACRQPCSSTISLFQRGQTLGLATSTNACRPSWRTCHCSSRERSWGRILAAGMEGWREENILKAATASVKAPRPAAGWRAGVSWWKGRRGSSQTWASQQ